MFFAKERFSTPDDLKKMKLFAWAGDNDAIEIWKAAGFQPVPLPSTEILTGLQTGLINAFDTTPLLALSSQWFGLAPYMLDLKWAPSWRDGRVQQGMGEGAARARRPS